MIWEGKKGEPSKPVMPLDLKVRPIVDGTYLVPKTIEFIRRNAAAKKPFYIYLGYSECTRPLSPTRISPASPPSVADYTPTCLVRWTTVPNDRFGVGFYDAIVSNASVPSFLGIRDEWGVEAFYNIALTPWAQLTPDLQYIDGGRPNSDPAWVLGCRLKIVF
jgi:carbohydrate-selective porin (OprB family)